VFSYGAAKLVPLAYGIKKLQIGCVVEDDKVCAVQCNVLVMVSCYSCIPLSHSADWY